MTITKALPRLDHIMLVVSRISAAPLILVATLYVWSLISFLSPNLRVLVNHPGLFTRAYLDPYIDQIGIYYIAMPVCWIVALIAFCRLPSKYARVLLTGVSSLMLGVGISIAVMCFTESDLSPFLSCLACIYCIIWFALIWTAFRFGLRQVLPIRLQLYNPSKSHARP